MSYYGAKGDFYGGGGYYRGDPGFLGGLLRTVAPIAASFIPGVGGLAARGVTALLGSGGGGGTPAAQSFAAPEVPETPAEGDRRSMPPILIVDDSLSVRKVAEKYVGELGYRTETAADGVAALEKIKRNPYLLVLTDLEMPRMHGFDLLAAIRKHEPTKELPIIVVTSRNADKHRWQARELGANDYITKPFSKEQLAEKFGRHLKVSPIQV